MNTLTDEYKSTLKCNEQQYDVYIVLDDETKVDADLSGFKPIFNLGERLVGNFVNKRIEFTLFNTAKYNLSDKEFEAFVGLKVGSEFVYNSIGKYIANKPQVKDEALDESSIVANDMSIKFKQKYVPVITFPCKIKLAVKAICDYLEVEYIENDFINADYELEEFYIDEDATFYDVIKVLAEAGFANAFITYDNKFIMKSPSKNACYKFDLNELFEMKKEDNLFGPLNSIIASRIVADDGSTTEDVYSRDKTSITTNGLYEYKIKQNDAIDYDRQTAVDNMLDGILDFKYSPATIEAVYNPKLEVGDMLEVPDKNTDTSFLLFAKEITADLSTGLMTIESSEESKTETNYTNATQKDKRIKTEIEVSKMKGKITLLSQTTDENTEKIAQLELTDEQIEQTVASNKIASDNDKQELLQKFDNYTTTSELATVENKVTQLQTDTYTKTQIDTKLVDGSVTKLKSTTLLADDDGLTVDKSDSKTKSNLDADGLTILDKTGSTNDVLLRAQYDEEKGETVVETKNLYVQKYLTVAETGRLEKYTRADGKVGVGGFYVGG